MKNASARLQGLGPLVAVGYGKPILPPGSERRLDHVA